MKYKPYSNNIRFKKIRKTLRKDSTQAEFLLWQRLRAKQLGVKFRRQYSIKNYIVDFYCHEHRLIIEIDGNIHGETAVREKDGIRQQCLESLEYTVIRYTNEQVRFETESVIIHILNTITSFQA